MKFEDAKVEIDRLHKLFAEPEPGLITWHGAVHEVMQRLIKGYSPLHKITIEKRADDIMAYIDGDKALWGRGVNYPAAVGDVVMTHPEVLNLSIERPA